jgi:hypothetical protein
MAKNSRSIAAHSLQPVSIGPPPNSRPSNSVEPIIPGQRYEIDAKFVRRTTREGDPVKPGVYEAGDDYWRARNRRGVAVIKHPLFDRALGIEKFHRYPEPVERGDKLHLVGVANDRGELDCRPIAVEPIAAMTATIVTQFSDETSFMVSGGEFGFVAVDYQSNQGMPLAPGFVVRFVGVRREHSLGMYYLNCGVDGATIEIISRRFFKRRRDWPKRIYWYHWERLSALYGGAFWHEIANDPAKLGHPRLKYWRDGTKNMLLSIAQRMRSGSPDTPSNMSETESVRFNNPGASLGVSDALFRSTLEGASYE